MDIYCPRSHSLPVADMGFEPNSSGLGVACPSHPEGPFSPQGRLLPSSPASSPSIDLGSVQVGGRAVGAGGGQDQCWHL